MLKRNTPWQGRVGIHPVFMRTWFSRFHEDDIALLDWRDDVYIHSLGERRLVLPDFRDCRAAVPGRPGGAGDVVEMPSGNHQSAIAPADGAYHAAKKPPHDRSKRARVLVIVAPIFAPARWTTRFSRGCRAVVGHRFDSPRGRETL
jgi:hypothetical protein